MLCQQGCSARGIHAGKIIGAAAKVVGGGGGGRPDMAQAGGKEPDQLKAALQTAREIVEKTWFNYRSFYVWYRTDVVMGRCYNAPP